MHGELRLAAAGDGKGGTRDPPRRIEQSDVGGKHTRRQLAFPHCVVDRARVAAGEAPSELVGAGQVADTSGSTPESAVSQGSFGVTTREPLSAKNALWGTPNFVVLPHVSGDNDEGGKQSIGLFCATPSLRRRLAAEDGEPRLSG